MSIKVTGISDSKETENDRKILMMPIKKQISDLSWSQTTNKNNKTYNEMSRKIQVMSISNDADNERKKSVTPIITKLPSSSNPNSCRASSINNEIMNGKTQKQVLLGVVLDSFAESTTHGLPHMVKRKSQIIRIVWAFCFLVSAIICSYMITLSLMSYFDYDTVTRAKRIQLLATEFPTISICNQNPFLTNVSFEYVKSELKKRGLIDPNNSSSSFNYLLYTNLLYFRTIVSVSALNKSISDDFRRSLGYNMSDMLLSCTFSNQFCTSNDFEWYFDLFYGNCFKFNSGKYANGSNATILLSTKAGSINGLAMELFLFEPKNIMSLSTSTGVHILVHNRTQIPIFYQGLSISSGSQASVQIDRVFSSYLEKPYSECVKQIDTTYPSRFVEPLTRKGFAYTQQNCLLACYQTYVSKICGCYDVFVQVVTNYPSLDDASYVPCLNLSQIMCDENEFVHFTTLDYRTICGDECPLECESIIFNLYTTTLEFPSQVYANSLINNPIIQAKYASNLSELTYDSLKRNMVQITFFYGDLGYNEYDEVPSMDWIDLVSNIGGTLGLFLGMSFLSFVEIIDIIMQIFLIKHKTSPNSLI